MTAPSTPHHPDLRGYQREGVDWIKQGFVHPTPAGSKPALLLADDPGLGKTLQALMVIDELGLSRILVIAPAIARLNWQVEIQRHFPQWSSRVTVILGGSMARQFRAMLSRDKLILIIGYDTLSLANTGWTTALLDEHWDLLCIDEAHYLKTPGALRTNYVYGLTHTRREHPQDPLISVAARVLLLTGTPTPNHAAELWTHCRALWPWSLEVPSRSGDGTKHIENKSEFEERYTTFRNSSAYGRQITGSKNQDRLRELLGPVVLRRRKREVLRDLPPVTYRDVPIEPSRMQAVALNDATRPFNALSRLIDDALLDQLRAHKDDEGALPLSSLRRQLGESKVDAAVNYVIERLDCGINKIIVFGWHTQVIVNLWRRLAEFSPVLVHGATPALKRAAAQHRFQTDPACRVYVGQIVASGTAISLPIADEVCIVEPSWVPGDNAQCIARADRFGRQSKNPILASFLFVPGTLDERIMRAFRRKAEDVSRIYEPNTTKGKLQHA